MNDEMEVFSGADFKNWKPSPEYLAQRRRAKELAAAARLTDAPPAYHCTNRVRVRGERLSRPIYWKGRQWAVTSYGVEARDGCYAIEKHRYEQDEPGYSWVQHMSGKEWVDLPDFAEAMRVARRIRAGIK